MPTYASMNSQRPLPEYERNAVAASVSAFCANSTFTRFCISCLYWKTDEKSDDIEPEIIVSEYAESSIMKGNGYPRMNAERITSAMENTERKNFSEIAFPRSFSESVSLLERFLTSANATPKSFANRKKAESA